MKQGEWLFTSEKFPNWGTRVICSHCNRVIDCHYKYSEVAHQNRFKIENPYCCKCGAKMG